MFRSIKPSTLAAIGLIAIAALTSCAKPETQGFDQNGVGGTGEEPVITALEEDSTGSLNAGAIEVGTLLRSQQTHHLINGKFAASVSELEIPVSTDNFDFQMDDLDDQNHVIIAQPKQGDLVAYAGGIHISSDLSQSEAIITCAADVGAEITPPTWADGKWTCGVGSSPVK